jgi:hypothetical protein
VRWPVGCEAHRVNSVSVERICHGNNNAVSAIGYAGLAANLSQPQRKSASLFALELR